MERCCENCVFIKKLISDGMEYEVCKNGCLIGCVESNFCNFKPKKKVTKENK